MTTAIKTYDFGSIPGLNYEIENIYRLLNILKGEATDNAVIEITTDLSAYVNKSLYASKGDMLVATGANSPAAFSVGVNGQVIVADSAQAKGMKWANENTKIIETSTTTASASANAVVHICNGASDYTLTMPGHTSGRVITITNINTGVVTLSPTSGTIAGSATETLYQYEALTLVSNGTNWEVGG